MSTETEAAPDSAEEGSVGAIVVEYYQLPFVEFHGHLQTSGYSWETPSRKRQSFWELVVPGEYYSDSARELLDLYLRDVERDLAGVLGSQSLGYWLHAYRRLSPGPVVGDGRPMTTMLVRAVLEAAIQKYAKLQPCNRIAMSDTVDAADVLDGALMRPGAYFVRIREGLRRFRQLVLTSFGAPQLKEIYEAEKLAYEVWRAMAIRRAVGKGASLVVGEIADRFCDCRSSELSTLIEIYDERLAGVSPVTATATVYSRSFEDIEDDGYLWLPLYNVGRGEMPTDLSCLLTNLPLVKLRMYTEAEGKFVPNFLWVPFDIRRFLQAHQCLAAAFSYRYGVSLESALVLLTCASLMASRSWVRNPRAFLRSCQRGYLGAFERDEVVAVIERLVGAASSVLGLPSEPSQRDLGKAFRLFELDDAKREGIDVAWPGPRPILLPFGPEHIFIDYAWSWDRLHHLFHRLPLKDAQFKGRLFEESVRSEPSPLPWKECKAHDGTRKQIDAAFCADDTLIVVECRAVARRTAVDKGDEDALGFRRKKIDKVLRDVDEKAEWLASRPVGRNYDIRRFKRILPLGMTPFPEYIHKLDSFYWVIPRLPRVLTPSELRRCLEDGSLSKAAASSPNSVDVAALMDDKP